MRVLFLSVDSGRGREKPRTTRFRNPPATRHIVGTKAQVFRLSLNKAQKRALNRNKAKKVDSSVGAVATVRGGGGTKFEAGSIAFCSRADPCDLSGGGPR